MSEARNDPRMTPDEFFVWQASQDRNYELVDGAPVLFQKMVTDHSRGRDYLKVNLLGLLRDALRGTAYRPHTEDIAIRLDNGDILRSDILVDAHSTSADTTLAIEPRVLIDILSPANTRLAHVSKIEAYKRRNGVGAILAFDTQTPSALLWRRDKEAGWVSETILGLDASIRLPEIETDLAMADIYEDLTFETSAG